MINAIGRRKASVARVYLTKGDGQVVINGKQLKEYFPQMHIQDSIVDPFKTVEAEKLYDIKYLTRDARVVERKKYGKPKARKSFQFSKR